MRELLYDICGDETGLVAKQLQGWIEDIKFAPFLTEHAPLRVLFVGNFGEKTFSRYGTADNLPVLIISHGRDPLAMEQLIRDEYHENEVKLIIEFYSDAKAFHRRLYPTTVAGVYDLSTLPDAVRT